MTQIIKTEFVKRIDTTTEYTLPELKKILTEVFKDIKDKEKEAKTKKIREKRERDENGNIVKKRPASAYNIFVKEQIAKIKETNPTIDSKAVFKLAIDEWRKMKGDAKVDDTADDAIAEEKDEEIVEEKEEEIAEEKEEEIVVEAPKKTTKKAAKKTTVKE